MRAEDVLADDQTFADVNGVRVRKGSVAAFLANAKVFSDPHTTEQARQEAQTHILEAVPALEAIGLFEIMDVRDKCLRALLGQS